MIDSVFIDAILVPLLRELGLPETLPLVKLSSRMQKWVFGETCLLRDAMSRSLCWSSTAIETSKNL